MIQDLIPDTRAVEIVGDTMRVTAEGVALGDLTMVESWPAEPSRQQSSRRVRHGELAGLLPQPRTHL